VRSVRPITDLKEGEMIGRVSEKNKTKNGHPSEHLTIKFIVTILLHIQLILSKGYNKHLMTGSTGTVSFVFLGPSMFPRGQCYTHALNCLFLQMIFVAVLNFKEAVKLLGLF